MLFKYILSIVRHMRPQNGDFRCTPLFRWVSWYRYVGNVLAFQFLLVSGSPGTYGMSQLRSKVKVTVKMGDFMKSAFFGISSVIL